MPREPSRARLPPRPPERREVGPAEEPRELTLERAEAAVRGLSHEDMARILTNLAWDAFGEVRGDGTEIIVPDRVPDEPDRRILIESLRDELFPREGEEAEEGDACTTP